MLMFNSWLRWKKDNNHLTKHEHEHFFEIKKSVIRIQRHQLF